MGSLFPRGRGPKKTLWLAYQDEEGKRVQASTRFSYRADDEEARLVAWRRGTELLGVLEGRAKANKKKIEALPLTVARYASRWLERREAKGLTIRRDRTYLKHYILPELGRLPLAEVRRREVKLFVDRLQGAAKLAPRTILHIYGTMRVMFADALGDEEIPATPCTLSARRKELPPKRDKDPRWRAQARYTRAEVVQLCTDPRVPWRNRTLYALLFLTGMRIGEAVARRWRDLERDPNGRARLMVHSSWQTPGAREKGTKTDAPRQVAVHRELDQALATWREHGWAEWYPAPVRRPPGPDDLIIPSASGRPWRSTQVWLGLQHDLARLGLRRRGVHDTRRTFITLMREDAVPADVVRFFTHGFDSAARDQVDAYTWFGWARLFEAIDALRITLSPPSIAPA